jgi:hypothetical protein
VIVDVERGSGITPTQPSPTDGEGSAAQRSIDHRPNAIRVAKHLVIPEAKDAIALFLDHLRTYLVDRFNVLTAVDFDDQFRAMTGEIRDEVPDRNLPAEVVLAEGFAQQAPKLSLRLGQSVS